MEQMDGAKLIFGDAIRAPEIVDLRVELGIDLVPALPLEWASDFFLREDPVTRHFHLSVERSALSIQTIPYNSALQRYFLKTFGCRASQADGAALEAGLAAKGMRATTAVSDAEVVVLNTCTVTATADDEVRQTVRRIHRAHPDTRILITGCYAQRAPAELAGLPGVSLVVGNSHKTLIPEILTQALPYHGQIQVGDIFEQRDFLSAPVEDALGDRTRPNLKIQDGCNNRCSFCIIPFVRGRSRSAPPDQVIQQVRRLSLKYREVVLSGINLGRWGREFDGKQRLVDLIRRLLDETPIERLRLSSVEPMDFSDALLALMAESPRIAKHVHAPLQSGSDGVLRRMHRKYRPRHYADRILCARSCMPDCAVGADVMTGFPGESEAEFEESRVFIESLPFTYLHVFTYSERPGTAAAEAVSQVPAEVRKHRTHVLRDLARRKNFEFRRSMIGRTVSAVTIEDGRKALSDNYLKVVLARPRDANRIENVVIGGLTSDGLCEAGMLPILGS
jgi:threonylcarbamoyladenosine tRNA methylthiotransferase MtaB